MPSVVAAGAESPVSSAVDLLQQSRQGFAALEAEARAKAEREKVNDPKAKDTEVGTTKLQSNDDDTKPREATGVGSSDTNVTIFSRAGSDDMDTKTNINRVTAFYLSDGDHQAAKHAA